MNKEILFKTFRNTSGAAIYIFLVSQIMQNGDKFFGATDNMFSPFVFLLLFSLSATIVGGLVLGQSLILFLNKKNNEGILSAVYSIGWLGFYTLFGLITLVFIK